MQRQPPNMTEEVKDKIKEQVGEELGNLIVGEETHIKEDSPFLSIKEAETKEALKKGKQKPFKGYPIINVFKVVKRGYSYRMKNLERTGHFFINFIRFLPDKKNPQEMKLIQDGTTTEAVTEVLINRLRYLNEKAPKEELTNAIMHYRHALSQLKRIK